MPADWTETHAPVRSFNDTLTLDEAGSGESGTFTVDMIGAYHSADIVTGSGVGVLEAGGTVGTDVHYHLVLTGHHDDTGNVIDTVTYSETGTSTANEGLTYTTTSYNGDEFTNELDATYNQSWSVLYTAVFADGTWTVTGYTANPATVVHWHTRTDDNQAGSYSEITVDTGFQDSESLAGPNSFAYMGDCWWDEHTHSHVPDPNGGPPTDYYGDNPSDAPFSGTAPLDPFAPDPSLVPWRAETPTAVDFTFHGVDTTNGRLTESAVYTNGQTDVPSYDVTGTESESDHLVEDEPSLPDSGLENYHKDRTYGADTTTTGSGSVVGGVYSGDYQVDRNRTDGADNVLDVRDSETSGTDDDGNPFDLLFNSRTEQVTNGSYQVTHDYMDNDAGTTLTGSNYTYSDGSTIADHQWGTLNGDPYDDSNTHTEAGSDSFPWPAEPGPIDTTIPIPVAPIGVPFAQCGGQTPPPPPIPGGVLFGGGPTEPLLHLPQEYYNHKIQKIGEDEKLKVGRTVAQMSVMQEMNLAAQSGDPMYSSGTFTKVNNGLTFAQAVGKDSDLDKRIDTAKENFEALGWTGAATTVDVKISYAVQPAAAGQDRSGKCVIQYQFIVNVTGTTKSGKAVSVVGDATLGGAGWFVDDNLKTATLTDR
jgi:hypothetical protein